MIRTTKIQKYLSFLQDRNIPAKKLLVGTGISLQELSNPDFLVDMEQHDAVVMNLIRLSKESDIAFTIGDRFDPSEMGIAGYALLSSRNLRNAMNIWTQYSNSLIGSPLRLEVAEQGGSRWSVFITPLTRHAELQRFYIEEFLISGLQLFQLLSSKPLSFHKISFAYAAPAHKSTYQKWFNCPIRFDAPETVFNFKSPGLDTPVKTNNEELNFVVSQYCQNILQQVPRSGSIEPRLRSLFLTNSSKLPDQGEASKQLGVSHRTLHRRLQRNGRTYSKLKGDFRLDLARQYLDSGQLSQKEISHALGYASPSAFCRAFKGWTGQSPGEYRNEKTKARG